MKKSAEYLRTFFLHFKKVYKNEGFFVLVPSVRTSHHILQRQARESPYLSSWCQILLMEPYLLRGELAAGHHRGFFICLKILLFQLIVLCKLI